MTDTASSQQYVTVTIGGQLFGIPISLVQDVFVPQRITHVPLAHPDVAGVLNLRGRIVTAIESRSRLGLAPRDAHATAMAIAIEQRGEPYGLIVDGVGEVLTLEAADRESNPANLDPRWRAVSAGVWRLKGQLLVALDVEKLLDFGTATRRAA